MKKKKRLGLLFLLALLFVSAIGCSTTTTPVEPNFDSPAVTCQVKTGKTVLLGMYQIYVDLENAMIQAVPLRTTENLLNVLTFLEPPAFGNLDLDFETLEIKWAKKTVDVDVIITHPITTPKGRFMGFDVRGVVIGPELLNADGLTPVMNPADFEGEAYGYIDGMFGTPNSVAHYDASYWGYKYFCDGLEPDDNFAEFCFNPANLAARGTFAEGATNTRHYSISWKDADYGFLVFNYAVIASYHAPDGPPPFEPDDFPINGGNMAEAFCIGALVDKNGLYFNDDGFGGGAIGLYVEVWDWQSLDATEVTLESVEDGLLGPAALDTYGPGHTDYSGVYHFVDVKGFPEAAGDFELLITATDNSITYGDSWFHGLLSTDNPFYYTPVYTCQRIAVNVPAVTMDWLPVGGQTGVELPAEPEQGARPPDLSVFSASQGESRGVTLFQEYPIEKFVEWNDGYSALEDEIPWLYGEYLNDVSRFDITIDGGIYGKVFQVTSYSHAPATPTDTYPGSSLTYLLHEANGEWVGISHISAGPFPYYHMDFGDVSCAVIGHDGSDKGQDENFYSIGGYSTMPGGNPDPDNPLPDDGEYRVMQWYYPYDTFTDPELFQRFRVFGMSARDPVDPGPIEDFEPRDQHLGVDDNTGVYLDWYGPGHPDYEWAEFFYILDNSSILHMVFVEFDHPRKVIYVAGVLPETWNGTAVDVEVAPAFTYTNWSPWGWSEVLIDKGNGTWTVMTLLWAINQKQEPVAVYIIDETDPLPGTPLALDIDNTDFEIHVIARVDDKVEATVFEWFDNYTGGG